MNWALERPLALGSGGPEDEMHCTRRRKGPGPRSTRASLHQLATVGAVFSIEEGELFHGRERRYEKSEEGARGIEKLANSSADPTSHHRCPCPNRGRPPGGATQTAARARRTRAWGT